ncbi:hypothetical protein GCM10027403_19440 [Arthrobacter tecti]
MNKKKVSVLTAAVALGATSMLFAPPASAALTTRCVGEAGAVTVPGDLVVPKDQSCNLTGTTITGNVRVAPGADLVAEDVTIEGQLSGAIDAYVEVIGGTVNGQVVLNGAFGAYLDGTTAGDRVLTRPSGDVTVGGFVYTANASIAGDLISRSGELFIETTDVIGSVDSRDSAYTDLHQSWVDGALRVQGTSFGSVICGTSVAGEAVFADNTDMLQIGADGPLDECTSGNYWGSNFSATGNTGGIVMDNNIVRGSVALTGNNPIAQLGMNNVRGEVTGEFEEWTGAPAEAPAADAPALSLPQTGSKNGGASTTPVPQQTLESAPTEALRTAPAESREAAIESKIEQRRAEAVKSADAAGPANIGK